MASPSEIEPGGYNLEFVDTIAEKYYCNICMKVLRDARLTECCGQHYCDCCLKKWLKQNESCPHCRSSCFQSIINLEKIREINEFKVRCTSTVKGCEWVGKLENLKHHLESDNGCGYVILNCKNSAEIYNEFVVCSAVVERHHLAHHQKNVCLYRQYKCEHCGYVDTYDAIAGRAKIKNNGSMVFGQGNHYNQCDEYPQKCSNKCGEENIKRKDIEEHRRACSLEPIDCPFKHVGCSLGKILRKDIDIHCKKNMQTHLLLVLQSNQALAHKVDELTRRIEENPSNKQVAQDDGKKTKGKVERDLNGEKIEIQPLLMMKLKKGDTWYLIDVKWMKQWKKYVGYEPFDQECMGNPEYFPGPVDTSNLFAEGRVAGMLKEHLMEELDYTMVPEPAWNKLVSWYGISDTSRPIARTVVEYGLYTKYQKVEVYLLNFKLCVHPKLEGHIIKPFSRAQTISDLEHELRNTFSIDQTRVCRVWHRYIHTYELLNDSTQTLQDAGLCNMQTIVLECQENGVWPRST